jgi:dihydroorotate dehydrogenase (NAD+) catalytic subunit
MADDDRICAVELNLSCPNVECGGLAFCAGPASVEEVVAACRSAVPHKPILAKLTNEGVVENARAAEGAGADGLTLINTIPALVVDSRERRVFLRGGLSGPAIKPIALRAVYEASRAIGVPVIGCGGAASGTDVVEFMLAGAAAVQVGAASFVWEPQKMLEEFAAYIRENRLRAKDLTGLI